MSSGIDDSTVAMYSSSAGSTGGRHSGCGRSSDNTDRDERGGGGDDGTGGGCLTAEAAVADAAGCAAAMPFSRSIVPVSSAAEVVSAMVSTAVSVAAAA